MLSTIRIEKSAFCLNGQDRNRHIARNLQTFLDSLDKLLKRGYNYYIISCRVTISSEGSEYDR